MPLPFTDFTLSLTNYGLADLLARRVGLGLAPVSESGVPAQNRAVKSDAVGAGGGLGDGSEGVVSDPWWKEG